jgi:DNA polymerase-3 subunit epsilon
MKRQRKKTAPGDFPVALQPLMQNPIWPAETTLDSLEFLVVDFETSGLDIHRDAILSIGWVVIKDNRVHLECARKIDILAADYIKAKTAVINHIVPETLINATPVTTALEQLFKAMHDRIIIAHSVSIERGFLNQYCLYYYHSKLPIIVWLDTLAMEGARPGRLSHSQPSDFGLSAIREKYGLPSYPAHDALIDAVATAELFLAQTRAIFGDQKATLGILMEYSRPNF